MKWRARRSTKTFEKEGIARMYTYSMANLRGAAGTMAKIGKKVKQMMKHTAAARLQPPKIIRRSHRDTMEFQLPVSKYHGHSRASHRIEMWVEKTRKERHGAKIEG